MQLYSKQKRQVRRLPKNQTKATRLAIKQHCNDQIKRLTKDRIKPKAVKEHLMKLYIKWKSEFNPLRIAVIALLAISVLSQTSCSSRICPAYNSYPKRNR